MGKKMIRVRTCYDNVKVGEVVTLYDREVGQVYFYQRDEHDVWHVSTYAGKEGGWFELYDLGEENVRELFVNVTCCGGTKRMFISPKVSECFPAEVLNNFHPVNGHLKFVA